MSDQSPTVSDIATANPPNGIGIKPRWWRRHLSPDEMLYVLHEGHWALGSRRAFRHLPSPPRCKLCFTPFGGLGGRVVRLAGFKPSRKNPSLCSHCCENMSRVLGGVEVDIAVLFADVRGSTALGERTSATEFAGLLNRFYKVATDTLVRHDAVIDKLIGDEVMAFFVRGISGPEYRQHAVDAGTELLSAVGYGTPEGPWLSIGVAVNAGTAYVGNVGGAVADFTALGDTVNVAARMQGEAAAGELLIREGVGARPSGEIPTRTLSLRGHEEPIEARVVTA